MKKSLTLLAAVLLLLVFSFAAEPSVLLAKNGTGFTISEIYISNSGTLNWEDGILGEDVLEDGETLRITVNGAYRKFDMRAVDETGAYVDWLQLPGSASRITIYADGSAEYR